MTNPEIKKQIKSNETSMIAFRQDLHAHPELPFEEFRTTKQIATELDKIGISYKLMKPTGIIADIQGGKTGKTIALRADIDALPIQELNKKLSYCSTITGKMHACGHDAHTAMLLNAAKVLYEIRETLSGNVRLIFQPAEEIGEGAKALIEQGALQGVDGIFGMHIWSQAPTGMVSCNTGAIFAAADLFKVSFKGRGGHGAMPQDTIDAVIIAAAFVNNIQHVISREINPLDPAVITIGRLEAGTRFNVVAENAVLEGTVRCFSVEMRDKIEASLRHYADHIAAIYGATATVEYSYGTLPVINEEKSATLAREIITESFGQQALYSEAPVMLGEDFSYYMQDIPGAFALVGSGNKEKETQYSHHHGQFNVDEDALIVGSELYAQYAWSFLNRFM